MIDLSNPGSVANIISVCSVLLSLGVLIYSVRTRGKAVYDITVHPQIGFNHIFSLKKGMILGKTLDIVVHSESSVPVVVSRVCLGLSKHPKEPHAYYTAIPANVDSIETGRSVNISSLDWSTFVDSYDPPCGDPRYWKVWVQISNGKWYHSKTLWKLGLVT